MPDWNGIVRQRFASIADQQAVRPALVEELALHLEDRYRELVAAGASGEVAYRETISELDDVYPLQADLAASWNFTAEAITDRGRDAAIAAATGPFFNAGRSRSSLSGGT